MSIRRTPLIAGAACLAILGGAIAFVDPAALLAYGRTEAVDPGPAAMERGRALCSDQRTVDELKRVVFTRAIENADRGDEALTILEANSVARMEEPVLTRYDRRLERAECEGRMVIELPRGLERLFDDQRRLREEVVYTAQPAADGSGLVYTIAEAGDTIDALAAADLDRVRVRRTGERRERYAERRREGPRIAPVTYERRARIEGRKRFDPREEWLEDPQLVPQLPKAVAVY